MIGQSPGRTIGRDYRAVPGQDYWRVPRPAETTETIGSDSESGRDYWRRLLASHRRAGLLPVAEAMARRQSAGRTIGESPGAGLAGETGYWLRV